MKLTEKIEKLLGRGVSDTIKIGEMKNCIALFYREDDKKFHNEELGKTFPLGKKVIEFYDKNTKEFLHVHERKWYYER